MPLSEGQILKATSQDHAFAEYKVHIMNDLTTDALADNTGGTYDKFDVAAWVELTNGSHPGMVVVATTLPKGRWNKVDLVSQNWIVQKYRYFWFRIVNGQRIAESSPLWDAGAGSYYPEVGITWTPAAIGFDAAIGNVTALSIATKKEALGAAK